MKKIFPLTMLLLFLTAAAGAQRAPGDRVLRYRVAQGVHNGQISRGERFQLRMDASRYKTMQRHARRDGIVTPYEKRRIYVMKAKTRRDIYRFRHNRRHRVI